MMHMLDMVKRILPQAGHVGIPPPRATMIFMATIGPSATWTACGTNLQHEQTDGESQHPRACASFQKRQMT